MIKLSEKLVPYTKEELQKFCDKNPKLEKFMNTPIKSLSKKYLNLFNDEDYFKFKEKTLKEIIDDLQNPMGLNVPNSICFLSESDQLEGFACYYTGALVSRGKCVLEITVFSLRPDGASWVLARDIKRLLDILQDNYRVINFTCKANQPLLDHYIKEVESRGGTYEYDEDDNTYFFEILGHKLQEHYKRLGIC